MKCFRKQFLLAYGNCGKHLAQDFPCVSEVTLKKKVKILWYLTQLI